ncbi:hypothetical protein B0H14DRAFT_3686406 [Mycena olivaceomarginata]|nr:hypothetical protein B0H14DRAFT_3686406 [Mycena olivaceomarginata]
MKGRSRAAVVWLVCASSYSTGWIGLTDTIQGQHKCLKQYDIILIVDDSGSMGPQDNDSPGTVSLWTLAKAAIGDLVTAVVEHNPQGIRMMFLNSKHGKKGVKTAAEVTKLFDTIEPVGLTPIGKKLQGILPYQHWWSKEPKRKKLYLVVTDVRPSDEKVLKKAITRAATGYSKRSESYISYIKCSFSTMFPALAPYAEAKRRHVLYD